MFLDELAKPDRSRESESLLDGGGAVSGSSHVDLIGGSMMSATACGAHGGLSFFDLASFLAAVLRFVFPLVCIELNLTMMWLQDAFTVVSYSRPACPEISCTMAMTDWLFEPESLDLGSKYRWLV